MAKQKSATAVKPSWTNRIVGTGEVDASQLLANPRNWRIHPQEQQDALSAVLDKVGWVQNVIVNKSTGFVVDGHLRVSLAIARGDKVPVSYVELTPEEECLILATFDRVTELATMDRGKLDALVAESVAAFPDLKDLLENIDALIAGEPEVSHITEGLTDEDAVPEAPVEPTTTLGDCWLLGRHRLLCGDSTSIDAVERLMAGQKADMVFTDPPYGIGADSMTLGTGKKEFYRSGFDGVRPEIAWLLILAPKVCIWGGNYFADQLPVSNDWLCWHKKNDGLSFSEFELAWTNFGTNTRLLSHHWGNEKKQHPTMKPVAVMEWAMGFASGSVLDPFLGSGSTLIACEKTGRTCYGMELAPAYCDVIIRRWQNFTGHEATLEGDDRTFNAIAASRQLVAA